MSHTVDQHFVDRPARVRKTYDAIIGASREFGPVEEDPKKTSIHLNRKSAFAGIQTRREFLILTVKADADIPDARISRREQASAHRWHHEIKLSDPDDLDHQVLGWLRRSYELSG